MIEEDQPNRTITDGRLPAPAPSDAGAPVAIDDGAVSRAFKDMLARARCGQPVRTEDYLPGGDSHPDQLLDLVYAEYLARAETGAPPEITELAARFPHIAERIRRQVELHEALDSDCSAPALVPDEPVSEASDPPSIGRYRVITRLGEGGQGIVYRGFHPELGRDVVIKVSRRVAAPGEADLLKAEARVLASLDHPGLARVYDLDSQDGKPFAVLEFVDGRTLDAVTTAEPIPFGRAARIVAEAADAVAYANGRGVVHRDMKPQNVLLDSVGRVRVIDFGLARLFSPTERTLADSGTISGTVQYMAPEQARGDTANIGPRTDVFGLGGVLHFLLTGTPLYSGGTKLDMLMKATNGEWDSSKLDAATVPARLREVCAKALAPNPADRYATATELADALRRAVTPVRGRFIAIGVLVAVAAVAVGTWWVTRTPPESTPVQPSVSPALPSNDPPVPQAKFNVRVWNEDKGKYREVVYALPLSTGDKLRYEADAPANRYLTLFAVEPNGAIHILTTSAPQSESGKISYPVNPQESSPLTPPNGTVIVLLCGRANSAVTIKEMRAALGAEPWPLLPARSFLLVERDKVEVFGGRGVGPPEGQPDPEGEVLRRLDVARAKLKGMCDVLAGIAVSFE